MTGAAIAATDAAASVGDHRRGVRDHVVPDDIELDDRRCLPSGCPAFGEGACAVRIEPAGAFPPVSVKPCTTVEGFPVDDEDATGYVSGWTAGCR